MEKLAVALGVGVVELIPGVPPADAEAVSREQARRLFESLMKNADRQTFALLNPFLALLAESAGTRA